MLAWLALASSGYAQAQTRLALVIGNEAYSGALTKLNRPHEDAERISGALRTGAFSVTPRKDLNRSDLLREVRGLADRLRQAGPDAVGFFYYSGHGASALMGDRRRNYVIPVGTSIAAPDDLVAEGVPLDDIIAILQRSKAKAIFIVFDACRSELPFSKGGADPDKAFNAVAAGPGMFIAYSTAEGTSSPDDGAFASALATQLVVPGRTHLTAFDAASRSVGRTREGNRKPWYSNQIDDDIYFVALPEKPIDPAARSAAVRRLQQSLKTLGQYSGAADGATGSATRAAAQAFATVQRIAVPDLAAAPIAAIEAFAARAEQAALVSTTQEAAAWRVAKDADTRAPLDAYLRDFPNGPNAAAARTRIASLTRSAAPAPAPTISAPSASSRSAGESFRDCSDCPQMVSIPAGSFMMGSPASEAGRYSDEGPQRRVTVPAFAAGKYEVTWAEWDRCVAAGACTSLKADGFGGGSRPVTNVSWDEAVAYTKWLSSKTGQTYRLLSEAEWEYAARAGNPGRWSFGDNEGSLGSYAWYSSNSGSATHAVGTKTVNAFGLHDMHGNVWEWVQDCYAGDYSAGQPSNGSAYNGSAYTSGSCSIRVLRGGSWYNYPQSLRSASRLRFDPTVRSNYLGFRVARTL